MLIIRFNPIKINEVEVILITRLHLNNGCKINIIDEAFSFY